MSEADEIEAIRQLEYRYFRFLDQKRYDDLAEQLIPECHFSYHSGTYTYTYTYTYPNRDAAIAFLKVRMHKPERLSLHQGHRPEITPPLPDNALVFEGFAEGGAFRAGARF
jgi:hypothetical protein